MPRRKRLVSEREDDKEDAQKDEEEEEGHAGAAAAAAAAGSAPKPTNGRKSGEGDEESAEELHLPLPHRRPNPFIDLRIPGGSVLAIPAHAICQAGRRRIMDAWSGAPGCAHDFGYFLVETAPGGQRRREEHVKGSHDPIRHLCTVEIWKSYSSVDGQHWSRNEQRSNTNYKEVDKRNGPYPGQKMEILHASEVFALEARANGTRPVVGRLPKGKSVTSFGPSWIEDDVEYYPIEEPFEGLVFKANVRPAVVSKRDPLSLFSGRTMRQDTNSMAIIKKYVILAAAMRREGGANGAAVNFSYKSCDLRRGRIVLSANEDMRLRHLSARAVMTEGHGPTYVCDTCHRADLSPIAASAHLSAHGFLDSKGKAVVPPLAKGSVTPLRFAACVSTIGAGRLKHSGWADKVQELTDDERKQVRTLIWAAFPTVGQAMGDVLNNMSGRVSLFALITKQGAVAACAVCVRERFGNYITLPYAATHPDAAGLGFMRLMVCYIRRWIHESEPQRRLTPLSVADRIPFWEHIGFAQGCTGLDNHQLVHAVQGAVPMQDVNPDEGPESAMERVIARLDLKDSWAQPPAKVRKLMKTAGSLSMWHQQDPS
eukprot:TRINITY_DN70654_c0_g1_i1.p1 TRINITY_DN70654_c0_g1~~TRINITY_DN70654_c0_g1_i1.p1  ORF type:complete len:628 (+),score=160.05 TRINITY_DN70654_c0_g1_i1:95-1885(+)